MITRNNIPVYDICWLSHADGGMVGTLYEPENIDELREICTMLYCEGKNFDLIGHTSNIYFMPNYNVEYMVSTRKCKNVVEEEDCIVCDCGVPVVRLARRMVNNGIKGFEGLVDLPGTVGAAVYGNASCYGCSINSMLHSLELLKPNGETVTLHQSDLKLSKRSSSLKRRETEGVILSIRLKKEKGDTAELQRMAEECHKKRMETQPGPKDNLGSIYAVSGGWSFYSYLPRAVSKCYALLLRLSGRGRNDVQRAKKSLLFSMLGAKELLPYVYGWNRYIWKDEQSHRLFWKFHKLHQKMFKQSKFEIEIKRNRK